MGRSYGFRPDGFNQIIIFNNERDLTIIGADDHTKREFPGVYIAGVMEEAN